jgi:hypothetical protein
MALLSLLIFIGGCGPDDTVVVPWPAEPSTTPNPVPAPKESDNKPAYICRGEGHITKVEIWWRDSAPTKKIYAGKLGQCRNDSAKAASAELEVKYPADGMSTDVDGHATSRVLVAKIYDDTNHSTEFVQYSEFITRSNSCSQGLFRAKNGEVIDIRIDEPVRNSGVVYTKDGAVNLKCE